MKDRGHITTGEDVKNALNPTNVFGSSDLDDPIALLEFYRNYSSEVHLVTCKNCEKALCLWISDPKQQRDNMRLHPSGLRRITIGSSLLSSRRRLDGEIGYQCKCGQDNIISEAEQGIVPQHHYDEAGTLLNPNTGLDMEPHHYAAYDARVSSSEWKPSKLQVNANTFELDGFRTERIK